MLLHENEILLFSLKRAEKNKENKLTDTLEIWLWSS